MPPIEKWSEQVAIVHLADDPAFTEELEGLEKADFAGQHLVLDFTAVHFINSSNLARLMRLRTKMHAAERKLVLCNIKTQVWSTLLATGLDKVFNLSDSMPTALASLQMQ